MMGQPAAKVEEIKKETQLLEDQKRREEEEFMRQYEENERRKAKKAQLLGIFVPFCKRFCSSFFFKRRKENARLRSVRG